MILKLLFGVDSVKDIKKQINSVLNIINSSNATKNILPSFTGLKLQEKSVKAYAVAIKGLNVAQAESVLSTTMLTSAQKAQVLSEAGLLTTTNALTAEQQEQLLTSGLITSEQMAQVASTLGLTTAEGGALVATEALNLENVKLQLTDMGIIGTTQAKIIEMLGLTAAEGAATGATGLLTKATLALNAAFKANPILFIATAIIGVVGAFHLYNNSVKGMIKNNQKLIDSNKEVYESILEEEKTFTDKSNNLKEVYDDYLIATKGSKEYYDAINKIAEISPELVVGYDNEGNAILANNEVIKEQIKYYRQLAEEKRNAAKQEAMDNLSEETESYQDLVGKKDSKQKQYDEAKATLDRYEQIIKDAESGKQLSEEDAFLYQTALTSIDGVRANVNELKEDLSDLSNQAATSANSLRTYYTALLEPVDNLTEAQKTLRNSLINTAIENGMNYTDFKEAEKTLEKSSIKEAANNILNLDNNLSKAEYRKQALAIFETVKDEFETESEKQAFQIAFGIDFETIQNEMQARNNTVGLTKELFGNDFNHISEQTKEAQQALQDEYDKIKDWGLEEYSDDIKNGTIQSVFGNVDMDKRTIIEWSDELKKIYQEELASWDYDPEVGGIDTVFGGSDRFGEDINGTGWEVAFTPILPDGTFLSKDAVYDYINNILVEAYSDDGKVTEEELKAIDAQGRQVGNTFVQGIFAGIDESQEYDNNGNWAETVGRLMHFSGDYGAVEIGQRALDASKALDDSYDWGTWFDEQGIDSDEEYDKWLKIAKGVKTAEEAMQKWIEANKEAEYASKNLTFSEQMSHVQSLSKGLDQLDTIMADVIDGKDFDYSSILNNTDFTETFGNYKEEYENFIETITESPDDLSKCQSAFDELATAYVHGTEALKNLTEETKEASILELEQMGVKNAKEVVDAYLALGRVKEEVAAHGYNFAEVTYEECVQLLQLADVSLHTKEALFYYQLQKQLSNENPLNTIADCQQLIALATNAGITGGIIDDLNEVIRLHSEISLAAQYQDKDTVNVLTAKAEKLIASIKAETDTMISGYKPTVNFGNGLKSLAAAQDKAKDATDKAKEALEKEKEALEDLKNEYDELYDAIQWFYDKQIDKIDKKIDALNDENEALEKQQENMDKILAAIESNYDAEIKLIQDKIDALKDENDEEERALALEEAKRKLQEAKSRKTLMVYQKGVGFTYQVDTKAIKEAEDELEELQENEVVAELEKQIEKLEEAKEKWSEIPEAYEKAMQEIAAMNYFGKNWKEITLNPSDELLNSFEGKYTGIQSSIAKNEDRIESYEKEKEAIEELKQAWEDAKNAYQYSQYESKLASFFGSDYEYQLLHNSAGWRRKFADEYSSICSQIEALEERIKASNESTASSTEASAGRVAEAAKGMGESIKYVFGDEEKAILKAAQDEFDQLTYWIDQGKTGFIGARDALAVFLQEYPKLNGATEASEALKDSVSNLQGIYENTGRSFGTMIDNADGRITDFEVKSKSLKDNLSDVDQELQSITNSESQVESNVNTELSEVDQTIINLQQHIKELKTALTELEGYKSQVETLATTATGELQTKVSEIQEAISVLNRSVNLLYTELGYFVEAISKLDATNITLLTTAFGGSGGEGASTGLLGAVHSVVKAIDGGEESDGLVQKLAFINKQENIQTLIDAFGIVENGTNLLSAVQTVANKIYTDDDNTCLYSIINKLTETISNINLVKDAFNEIGTTVDNCITLVNDLKSAIDKLEDKTVTITIKQVGNVPDIGFGSGTAHFGSGTAHISKSGDAYFNGTGNIGLSRKHPNSLVGELGTELKVSKDGSYELITSPTIMDLEKGDMIFNHEQTEEILKHGNRSNVAKLDSKAKSVYTKLTGSAFAKGTMNENVLNAIMHGLQFAMNPTDVMPKFTHSINNMPETRNEQNFNVTIGDIYLNGVQDTNGLARAIKDKLPRLMVQELSKR